MCIRDSFSADANAPNSPGDLTFENLFTAPTNAPKYLTNLSPLTIGSVAPLLPNFILPSSGVSITVSPIAPIVILPLLNIPILPSSFEFIIILLLLISISDSDLSEKFPTSGVNAGLNPSLGEFSESRIVDSVLSSIFSRWLFLPVDICTVDENSVLSFF